VIKGTGLSPIVGDVAAAAIGTETAFVRIFVTVASGAGYRRVAEFRVCSVTRYAGKTDMAAGERELRQHMVEQSRIEEHDVSVPPLVVRMTATTLRSGDFGAAPMESCVSG